MIPKVQAVRRDPSSLTVQVIYTDKTIETYMDGFSRLFEIKIGLTKSQVHQIVNLSKTTIKTGTASNSTASSSANSSSANNSTNNSSSKTSGGSVFAGAHLDPQTFDPLRARVEAAGAYRNSPWATVKVPDLSAQAKSKAASRSLASDTLGTASYTSAPWDDPLTAQTNDNIVACMDIPEWKPDCKPNNYILPNQIYYHDRFPSISVSALVEDAINILKKEKKLNISIHSLSREGTDWRLVYKTISNNIAPDLKQGKLIECILTSKTFERFSHDLDRYAKLKAKWNTNTYIKMRIAYLLFRALRLNKHDAEAVNLDIFRILGISSHPIFTY